jgi:hypothetical protein
MRERSSPPLRKEELTMIVPMKFGVTPERITAAAINTKLEPAALENLKKLTAIQVDLHVSEDGKVTGGHVIDAVQTTVPQERPAVNMESVLAAYLRTRDDEIEALNRKIKELKAIQDKREEYLTAQLLKLQKEQGTDTYKKNGLGTLFFTTKTSVKVSDREAFHTWVVENHKTDFLTAAVSKDQVVHMLEEEKALPPGVEYKTFKELSIRKA